MHIDKDLVAASATPLVLSILSEGESYGYAILKRVRELSEGELEWTDGMLYPLLHRLHRLGYVTTEWHTPPQGRHRKYYAITDEGRSALAEQQRQWTTVTRALNDAWKQCDIRPTTIRRLLKNEVSAAVAHLEAPFVVLSRARSAATIAPCVLDWRVPGAQRPREVMYQQPTGA